jgi:hypothetical protein
MKPLTWLCAIALSLTMGGCAIDVVDTGFENGDEPVLNGSDDDVGEQVSDRQSHEVTDPATALRSSAGPSKPTPDPWIITTPTKPTPDPWKPGGSDDEKSGESQSSAP